VEEYKVILIVEKVYILKAESSDSAEDMAIENIKDPESVTIIEAIVKETKTLTP
jgi:hypothetical protein